MLTESRNCYTCSTLMGGQAKLSPVRCKWFSCNLSVSDSLHQDMSACTTLHVGSALCQEYFQMTQSCFQTVLGQEFQFG